MIEKLAKRIIETEKFQSDWLSIYAESISRYLGNCQATHRLEKNDVVKLLQSALIFSSTNNSAYKTQAYSIAVAIYTLYKDDSDFTNLLAIFHTILANLGNFPTIDYLFRSEKIKNQQLVYSLLPLPVLLDFLAHWNENTVQTDYDNIVLTDFQKQLWDRFNTHRILSVSAPTSAGKSFALQQFIINSFLNNSEKFVLYIVPTRALISQVADSLIFEIKKKQLSVPVITIPESPNDLGVSSGIYVLTQERTHALLTHNLIKFELIVSDEAQTMGDRERGILLQMTIEKLIRSNPCAKFFFGSPFSKNPDYFKFLFDTEIFSIKEKVSPVAQNLIMVDTHQGVPGKLSFHLFTGAKDKPHFLQECVFTDREFVEEISSLAFISTLLGYKEKSIVYSGSPAQCESISDKICQEIADCNEKQGAQPVQNDSLQELAKFIRNHIHEGYILADFVEKGVGFHYGKMPALLRKAIEKSFEQSNGLNYLVCTSTLLHGVNLPAKNLFILKPSEGNRWLSSQATPMGASSFWNLAGRAGRLGKDFEGNVFLINHAQWELNPLTDGRDNIIKSSFFETISENIQDIFDYANGIKKNYDPKIIDCFTKIYCDYKAGRLNKVLKKSPIAIDDNVIVKLSELCKEKKYMVSDNIIENNIGISPIDQERMLQYIQHSINKGDYEKLIPIHPLSTTSYESYIRFFGRLKKYFELSGQSSKAKQNTRTAAIALAWMRGAPYPEIIKKSFEHKKNASPKASLQATIRETMDFIENKLRFSLVQQSKCYFELLAFALKENNLQDEIIKIPALPLFLELGACSKTMVNFIGLGLSRTTAGLLANKASNTNMDREKAMNWLLKQNLDAYDFPAICMEEINALKATINKF